MRLRLHRHHSATDIDADRSRDDRALRRDHASHGRPDTPVNVRHRGDPFEDEGKLGGISQLLTRLILQLDTFVQALIGTPFSGAITL